MTVFTLRRLVGATLLASLALLPLVAPAAANEYKIGDLTVERPWTRATTVQTGAAYMTLRVAGQTADRLVKVTSPDTERVEIHTMSMEGGVARMREIPGIDVKPGVATQLRPGGYHLMLIGLRRPLREGESIKLTLTFERSGNVDVEATVEKAGAPGPKKHSH